MTKSERNEWRRWLRFFVRRIRELVFLTAWVIMYWALDRYVIVAFPIAGPPKYMLRVFEAGFDIYTLFELVMMFVWPYKTPTQRWLLKRFSGRRNALTKSCRHPDEPVGKKRS